MPLNHHHMTRENRLRNAKTLARHLTKCFGLKKAIKACQENHWDLELESLQSQLDISDSRQ